MGKQTFVVTVDRTTIPGSVWPKEGPHLVRYFNEYPRARDLWRNVAREYAARLWPGGDVTFHTEASFDAWCRELPKRFGHTFVFETPGGETS